MAKTIYEDEDFYRGYVAREDAATALPLPFKSSTSIL